MSWFSKALLGNSLVALKFSMLVTRWLHAWGCLVVRPCMISLRLLTRDFEQNHFCFVHVLFHNFRVLSNQQYILLSYDLHSCLSCIPVCPLVLCCNSNCYCPVSVISIPSPFIFCAWCSSSSVSLSRLITLLCKCTVCS